MTGRSPELAGSSTRRLPLRGWSLRGRPAMEKWGSVGHAVLWSGLAWVIYILIAFTINSGYESDEVAAAEKAGVDTNRLDPQTRAVIHQDHAANLIVPSIILMLAPVPLILATLRARRAEASRLTTFAVVSAVAAGALWWSHMILTFGLFFGADGLPPLTRDLDTIAVPLVTAASALALLAMVAVGEALRRSGVISVAAWIGNGLGLVMMVAGVAAAVIGGFESPLPPVCVVIPSFILGIATLLAVSRQPISRDLEVRTSVR